MCFLLGQLVKNTVKNISKNIQKHHAGWTRCYIIPRVEDGKSLSKASFLRVHSSIFAGCTREPENGTAPPEEEIRNLEIITLKCIPHFRVSFLVKGRLVD